MPHNQGETALSTRQPGRQGRQPSSHHTQGTPVSMFQVLDVPTSASPRECRQLLSLAAVGGASLGPVTLQHSGDCDNRGSAGYRADQQLTLLKSIPSCHTCLQKVRLRRPHRHTVTSHNGITPCCRLRPLTGPGDCPAYSRDTLKAAS